MRRRVPARRHEGTAGSVVAVAATLHGEKILITGPTGQVAGSVARTLAVDNEVWGLARFKDEHARAELGKAGIHCVAHDLSTGAPLTGVPRDFTILCNFAVVKSGNFARDLAANAEGAGHVIRHCRGARAVLHCSSTAVYAPNGGKPLAEDAPLGDHHRALMPTYSIAKIAAETVVRFAAREHDVPTTIARLNVPYGDRAGWPAFHLAMIEAGLPIPVHPDGSRYNPIHDDDIVRMVPVLLGVATVPATTVNWAGTEVVSIEEWSRFLAETVGVGREPTFEVSDDAVPSAVIDTTRMHDLIGASEINWRDGLGRWQAK